MSLRRTLIWGTLLLLALVLASSAWDIWRARGRTIENRQSDLRNLARALAGQTAQSIDTVDVLLEDVEQLVREHTVTPQRLRENLISVSAVDSLAVFDARGKLVARIVRDGVAEPVIAPEHLSPSENPAVGIGPADALGEPRLLVARRVTRASGAPIATLVATMDASHFSGFYSAIRLPAGGIVNLYRRDGTLLARVPRLTGPPLSRDPSFHAALAAGVPASLNVLSPADQVKRLIALEPLEGLPLMVGVGVSERVALARWREYSWHIALRTVIMSATLIGLLAVVLRELRRREAADAELRKSEERYAAAMAGSEEGHWDWNVAGGTVYLSARLMQMLGYKREDLFADDRWLERQGLLEQEQDERRRSAVRAHFAGHSGKYECEFRIKRGDEERWLLDRGMAMRDASGRVYRMSGVMIDITERKLAEERLREQAKLLELAHDALIVRDRNDAITAWNQGAERTYGWSSSEACGKVSHELLGTRLPVPLEDIERELAETDHWQGELIQRRKDGTRAVVDSRWTVQRDERGCVVSWLEINNDITERKLALAEQAQLEQRLREAEKLEALGTLASGIAHDFNNILGAILGYGDMAHRAAAEGSDLQRHTGSVLAAAQRARALVDQILNYSRSQRGARNPVDVRAIVDETLDLLRASLPTQIQLEVHGDAEPLVVICDPTQVHQIVMNLCTNAVHAMAQGGTLRVEQGREEVPAGRPLSHGTLLPGSYARLTVSDTGTGMPADLLKHAFEPFFTTKEPGAGTGLGLALVQNIVTELGGAIDVRSAAGEGSTFAVYLPRFDTAAAGAEPVSTLAYGSGQRVMVVEDQRPMLLLAEEMLASLGYEPAGFLEPSAAIEALVGEPSQFDAAVIDYVLPGMTGIELTRLLRRHRADLPVVLLSGYRGPMLQQEARAAGIARVLEKPMRIEALGGAMAAIVR